MVAQNVAFWILAIAMAGAAIGVVRSQNVVHAALYLVVVMAGAAAQYILVAAEFVAWVQVIIYIGAVITPNTKRLTTAAARRWLLSILPSDRIGARVSMMPNRNRMTMAPM